MARSPVNRSLSRVRTVPKRRMVRLFKGEGKKTVTKALKDTLSPKIQVQGKYMLKVIKKIN